MIPPGYQNFLLVSTQASAALIGLLFVSVSVAPERVFGHRAETGRQAQALSAFTALVNVFFISFISLIPNQQMGPVVVILGAVSASQTLSLLFLVPSWRRERIVVRALLLFAASGTLYGYQIATGLRLWSTPSDTAALRVLLYLLLAGYGVGLGRAWELLGAPYRSGLVSRALGLFRGQLGARDTRVTNSSSSEETGPRPDDR